MIDDWFKKKAWKRHKRRELHVQTVHLQLNPVPAGFMALSICQQPVAHLPDGHGKTGWENTVFPACYLAYVAVQRQLQRQGIGTHLLMAAVNATLEVSRHVGVHGLVLNAIDASKVDYYSKFGFGLIGPDSASPLMLLPIDSIRDLARDEDPFRVGA